MDANLAELNEYIYPLNARLKYLLGYLPYRELVPNL